MRGKPQASRVDNSPEFVSQGLGLWAYFNGVKLDFSRPGKPTENAVIESFNGTLRDECLIQHWFVSLDDAQAVTQAWREGYNRVCPHGAMANNSAGTKLGAASEPIAIPPTDPYSEKVVSTVTAWLATSRPLRYM